MTTYKPNHSIDKLFKDALQHHREEVPTEIWENISAKVKHKHKIRLIKIYLSLAASISLLIATGVAYYLYKQENVSFLSFKNSSKTKSSTFSPIVISKKNQESQFVLTNSKLNGENISYSVKEKYINNFNTTYVGHDTLNRRKFVAQNQEPLYSLSSRIGFCTIYRNNNLKKIKSNELARTQENISSTSFFNYYGLAFSFAPLYSYRSVGGIQAKTLNELEKPAITYSVGISTMAASKRIQFSTGLFYTQMGIQIENVNYYKFSTSMIKDRRLAPETSVENLIHSTGSIKPHNEILFLSNSSVVIAYEFPKRNLLISYNETITNDTDEQLIYEEKFGKLVQRFHYLEIPINIQYNIYQTNSIKLGFQTGINLNFLVSNSIFLKANEGSIEKIGRTTNVNRTNFVGNLGLSFVYQLNTHIGLLIEPRIRYHLQSINKGGTPVTYPYSYGIYTGIIYRY